MSTFETTSNEFTSAMASPLWGQSRFSRAACTAIHDFASKSTLTPLATGSGRNLDAPLGRYLAGRIGFLLDHEPVPLGHGVPQNHDGQRRHDADQGGIQVEHGRLPYGRGGGFRDKQ